jgi:hypothetical protein
VSNSAANGVKPEIIDNINSLLGLRIWRIFNEDRFETRILPLPTNQYEISADEVLKLVNTAHDTLSLLLDIRDMIKVDPENQQLIDIHELKSKLEQIVEKRGDIGDFVSRPESREITAGELEDMNDAIDQAQKCLEKIQSLPSEKASLPNTNRIQKPNNVGIVYCTHAALMTLRSDFIGKINHIAGSSLRGIKDLSILLNPKSEDELSAMFIDEDEKNKFRDAVSSIHKSLSTISELACEDIIKNDHHPDRPRLLDTLNEIITPLNRIQQCPTFLSKDDNRDEISEKREQALKAIAVMGCLIGIDNHNGQSMGTSLALEME